MKKQILIVIGLLFCLSVQAQQEFRNTNLSIDERAQLLLNQLTLEEKLGMM